MTLSLENVLSKNRADNLYLSRAFTRLDGADDSTQNINVGLTSTDRAVLIDYAVELPTTDYVQTGSIVISYNGSTANVDDHEFSYRTDEISGISFSADIDSGNIRLVFTKSAVGDTTTLWYRLSPVLIPT